MENSERESRTVNLPMGSIRFKPSTLEALRQISAKEALPVTQIIRLAIEEIATRGWTDVLPEKRKK